MQKRFLQQASKEYSPGQRLAALAVEGSFFLFLLPAGIVVAGWKLDARFHLSPLPDATWLLVFSVLLTLAGFIFAMWAVVVQFTMGRGTPAPVMATQKLIIQPPYSFCRNPMALGTIALYLGIALFARSPAAIGLVALFSILLLLYIKFVEEREMVARFGESYEAYRRNTPFLIPRPWRK